MKKILLSVLLLLLGSQMGLAQSGNRELAITLFGGFYNATSNVLDESFDGFGSIEARHLGAAAFGGKLTNWISPTVGLESSVSYTQNALEIDVFGEQGEIDAVLLFSSLQIVLGFGQQTRFQLGGGLGLVTSSFDEFLEGDTHLSGVLSAGLSLPLGSNLALRLSVEDHLHKVFWELDGVMSQEIFQNDLIYGIGLSVRSFY